MRLGLAAAGACGQSRRARTNTRVSLVSCGAMSTADGDDDPAAGANPTSAPQNQTQPGHNAAQGLNPFGDTPSQRVLLTKAIAGESLRNVNRKRGVTKGAHGANPDDVVTKDFAQMGLVQQHEQIMDTEYIGARAYKNKRMLLGEIMDSVYVNSAIVCIVFIDVISIMVYELKVDEEKDCFGRDFPEQEIITLCCLSGYVVELLLRGFGKGWRQSYSLERKNADNIFDATIIIGMLLFVLMVANTLFVALCCDICQVFLLTGSSQWQYLS